MGQMAVPMGQMPQQNQIPTTGVPMNNQMNVAMANQMNTQVSNVMPQQMINNSSTSGPMMAAGMVPNQMNSSPMMNGPGPLPGHMTNVMNTTMGQQMPLSPMQSNQMNMQTQMNHLGATRKV